MNFSDLRKKYGVSQESLAKELGLTQTAISKWESGEAKPKIETIKKISKLFGVSVSEILECF